MSAIDRSAGAARLAPPVALGSLASEQGPRAVAISGGIVVDLVGAARRDPVLAGEAERLGLPAGIRAIDLVAAGPPAWGFVEAALERAAAGRLGEAVEPLGQVTLAAPLPRPGKLVCFGRVYPGRSRRAGNGAAEEPNVFLKPSTAVVGPGATVRIPRRLSHDMACGTELVLVIGRRARDLAPGTEWDAVFGFTILNDIAALALPRPRARLLDTFAPMGPWIVPTGALGDPQAVGLRLRVGGRLVQDGSTSEMRFDIPYLLRLLSGEQTLEPGDMVATGDVGGEAVDFCGQVLEAEVDGIGVLRNPTEVCAG